MKRFLGEIRGVQKIEWILLAAAVAMMLTLGLGQSNQTSSKRTEAENRLISALSAIEGIGRTDVLLSEKDGKTSVLIIAEGAEDMNVQLHIQRAVQTMVGNELSDIEIIPHSG